MKIGSKGNVVAIQLHKENYIQLITNETASMTGKYRGRKCQNHARAPVIDAQDSEKPD